MPALMLAESDGEKASLIVPPRTFNPSRTLRSMDTGPERKFRLTKLLQQEIVKHPTVTTWGMKKPDETAVLQGLGYIGFGEGDRPNPSVLCTQ